MLGVTALLAGMLAATWVRSRSDREVTGRSAVGALLSLLAIGCPACNKLVVLLLGTSGALSLWAPLQPILAIVSIVLLGWALKARLAAEGAVALSDRSTCSTLVGSTVRPLGRVR